MVLGRDLRLDRALFDPLNPTDETRVAAGNSSTESMISGTGGAHGAILSHDGDLEISRPGSIGKAKGSYAKHADHCLTVISFPKAVAFTRLALDPKRDCFVWYTPPQLKA